MNQDLSQHSPEPPWYRQFWPWFIIALPASAVIAGLTTLMIAINNADDLVADDWYRDGRAINRNLDAERLASQLGVSATLSQHNGVVDVALRADAPLPWPETLQLFLRHPTQAKRDVTLTLVHQGNGRYSAPAALIEGERYISLQDEHWRLAQKSMLGDAIVVDVSS